MRDSDETKLKIIFTLISGKRAVGLYELAKITKLSPQLLKYHLPKLVEHGAILRINQNGKILYTPQYVFINDQIYEECANTLKSLIETLGENLVYEQCKDKEKALRECIKLYLTSIAMEM